MYTFLSLCLSFSTGKIGDWKNTFTVAQSALFDKIYALKMQGTGLEFDFEL